VRASPAIELPRMDDWHLHLRDGRAMRVYAHASAAQCRFALVMPNLDPPVTTVAAALEYRARILAALGRMPMSGARESTDAHAETDKGADAESFTPLMTLYLTDETLPSEIEAAARTGLIPAAKLYPAGATTNSARGVTDVARLAPVLAAMERTGLVLCVHGEVTDPAVDVFDREAVFIQTVLAPLLCAHPRLRVVLEHVTSRAGVAFVDAFDSDRLAATVTPQHALLSRAALFAGGRLRPHAYCLPVYKTADDQAAVAAAAAGAVAHPHRFFAGTDSAPHRKGNKGTDHMSWLTRLTFYTNSSLSCAVVLCPLFFHFLHRVRGRLCGMLHGATRHATVRRGSFPPSHRCAWVHRRRERQCGRNGRDCGTATGVPV
jgi:dihydroorotase